jgi:hypothetical protein
MITLEIDIASMRCTGQNVVGTIFFRDGDFAFPSEGWTDFVRVILHSWENALARLSDSPKRNATFVFMDGPFEIHLSHSSEGISMDFSPGSGVIARRTIELESLAKQVSDARLAVESECRRRGWMP